MITDPGWSDHNMANRQMNQQSILEVLTWASLLTYIDGFIILRAN